MGKILIGVSGWTYPPWRASFYPAGLKQKDELAYASQKLGSIEVNGTFYSTLRPEHYASWYEQTAPGIVLSLKGPKYLTHVQRLKEFATPLSNFLASGVLGLKEKLGPILWQFPPSLPFDPARFEPFMAALPHDTQAASALACQHSDWLKARALVETDANRPMRHAIEARHASFREPDFVAMARRYGIAIVVGDTAGRWPLIEDVTADFVYVRMHADETVYPQGYTREALERWAAKYQAWSTGETPAGVSLLTPAAAKQPRPVYAYFDNDEKTTAPFDALSMIAYLNGGELILQRPTAQPEPIAKSPVKAKAAKDSQVKAKAKEKAPADKPAKPKKPAAAKAKKPGKAKSSRTDAA